MGKRRRSADDAPESSEASSTSLVVVPTSASASTSCVPVLSEYEAAKRARLARRAERSASTADDAERLYAKGKWCLAEKQVCEQQLAALLEERGLSVDSSEFLDGLSRRAHRRNGGAEPSLLNTGRARRGALERKFWVELADATNTALASDGRKPRAWKAVYDWVHMRYLGSKGGQVRPLL